MKYFITTIATLVLAVLILFALPRPHFEIEPERPHFWNYPQLSEAHYTTEVLPDGKISIELEHPILKGITPQMIAWWYKNLASGKATVNGLGQSKEYEFYQLFHLSEHGQTRIVRPATNGTDGMDVGAVVYRQERFGKFLSKGRGRVESFSDHGFTVVPIMGPLNLGRIEHHFEETKLGTKYIVKTVLGSDLFILGRLLNYYIRKKQFPPEVIQEWIRHQVEEVGGLVHFLPAVYKQRDSKKISI